MRYAMIMAGGSGTRLWPMSRRARPKQLIPFIRGRSLLEVAADRIGELVPHAQQLICTSESFRPFIREMLPRFGDAQILGEPVQRDTVNAVALTAAVLAKRDPDAVFAVLTADHLITPEDRFRAILERGFELVEANGDRLVTFSIEPTYPATQYGYVERDQPIAGFEGAHTVERFVEKPETEKKAQYLIDTGRCAWNSGMFIFSAAGFLRALKHFLPDTHEAVARIADAWGTPRQEEVLAQTYPKLKKISVDYAIMQPASTSDDFEVCTVQMALQWLDVGSWPSFAETLADTADDGGNRHDARFTPLDSANCVAVSDDPEHVIATIGCRDLIIIHTADATLVCHREQAEKVKTLAEDLIDEAHR